MFLDAPEAAMDSQLRATFECLRAVLASTKPSNIVPANTWTRRDMGGYDFVMPHRELTGFSLVARVPDAGDSVSFAYSGCTRRDRGDEFDAAFAANRAETVQTVMRGEDFSGALREVLVGYLRRALLVVRHIRNDGEAAATEVFWPSGEGESEPVLLWEEHCRGFSLHKQRAVKSETAFDQREPHNE
jgi:hypothetical protein